MLHLSCHGGPGQLELEDEDGKAVPTTANDLIEPIRRHGRPLPLVFLSPATAALSGTRRRVSRNRCCVPACPAWSPCRRRSATTTPLNWLARSTRTWPAANPRWSAAVLAEARKEVEQARLQAVQRHAPPAETQPEYATAALYVAGDEVPLADFSLDKEPLGERPVYHVAGPVPQLRIDDLIGRRRELRETLRSMRDPARRHAGVILTGLGGVGKSGVAGRVMQRLKEDGWWVAARAGRFDLRAIAATLGVVLLGSERDEIQKRAGLLVSLNLDDGTRFQLISKTLAEDPVVVVLDDFEQNLSVGGTVFLDPDVSLFFGILAQNASRGRLLLTCRYPVPGMEAYLHEVPIGPLGPAESRKLVQRLPGLKERTPVEIAQVLRVIGGHPRILEFLDALLRDGEGRLPHVTKKLQGAIDATRIEVGTPATSLDDRLQQAVLLGMRTCCSRSWSRSRAAMATPTCSFKPPFPRSRPRPRASHTCSRTAPRTPRAFGEPSRDWRTCRWSFASRTARPGSIAGPPKGLPRSMTRPRKPSGATAPAAIACGAWSTKATTSAMRSKPFEIFSPGATSMQPCGSQMPASMPCGGSDSRRGSPRSQVRCSKSSPAITRVTPLLLTRRPNHTSRWG